jgi:hypothetical protein
MMARRSGQAAQEGAGVAFRLGLPYPRQVPAEHGRYPGQARCAIAPRRELLNQAHVTANHAALARRCLSDPG